MIKRGGHFSFLPYKVILGLLNICVFFLQQALVLLLYKLNREIKSGIDSLNNRK